MQRIKRQFIKSSTSRTSSGISKDEQSAKETSDALKQAIGDKANSTTTAQCSTGGRNCHRWSAVAQDVVVQTSKFMRPGEKNLGLHIAMIYRSFLQEMCRGAVLSASRGERCLPAIKSGKSRCKINSAL